MAREAGCLSGRKIVVTGAASGMGEGIARLFAGEGARLMLLDIAENRLGEVAESLEQDWMVCDVGDETSVAGAIDRAAETMGGIDGLVNVAGILIRKQLRDTTYSDFQKLIGVNLAGPFLLCRAALAHLERAEFATIVNVASLAGLRSQPGLAVYSATKAGLIALTEAFSGELGPTVRANAICPGVIRTPMIEYMFEDDASSQATAALNRAGRAGTPDDVARACLFLSTQESDFISSASLSVTGGHFR